MEYIAKNLKSEEIIYDLRQYRLRCNGHIISLAIYAFLFEK